MSEPEDQVMKLLDAIATAGRLTSSIIPSTVAKVKKELALKAPKGYDVNPASGEMVVAVAMAVNALMLIEDHPKLTPEILLELAKTVLEAVEKPKANSPEKATLNEAVKRALRESRAAKAKEKPLISDEELGRMFNFNPEGE